MARVTSSVRSCRIFCSSAMQKAWIRARYQTTNDFSAAGTSVTGEGSVTAVAARSGESAGGAARRANIAEVTSFAQLVADERTERVPEVGFGPAPPRELRRRADGAHHALVHECDAVAQRFRLVHVVSGEQDGEAGVLEVVDPLPHAGPADRIESEGRLVEDPEGGPVDERLRELEPPHHPARVRRHQLVG